MSAERIERSRSEQPTTDDSENTTSGGESESVPDGDEVAAKLAALAGSSWRVRPNSMRLDQRAQEVYYLRPLPLRTGLRYQLVPGKDEMLILDMDLNDPSLERRGIGSLLLIKATQVTLKHRNPDLAMAVRGQGNGGLVGAMEKAFGEENVSYRIPEDRPDGSDAVCDIRADIDPDRILAINFTERLGQLATSGHVWEPTC